jgi:drug/metabolite transporter (DMT)-like permease
MVNYSDVFSLSMLILFIKAILSAAAFLFVMLSIKNLEISEALPLLALTPGLVAVFGIFLINDYLTELEWLGIFLMIAGSYILEMKKNTKSLWEPFKSLFNFSKYSYVFIALILFTVTSLLDRILLKKYSLPPYSFMAFQQLFFVFIFAAAVLFKKGTDFTDIKRISKNTFLLIIIVSIFTVIYRYAQIEATKLAQAALVVSVKRFSVLMAIIFGGKLFGEPGLTRRIVAAVIILIGLTMLMQE